MKYSSEHRLVVLLFVNKCVTQSIFGKKDLSRVVILVSLNGDRHNLKEYIFSRLHESGGVSIALSCRSIYYKFYAAMRAYYACCPAPSRQVYQFFFSQGKNCLQYLKKLRRHLFQNYFMHATGTFCRKDQQPNFRYQSEKSVSSDVTILMLP